MIPTAMRLLVALSFLLALTRVAVKRYRGDWHASGVGALLYLAQVGAQAPLMFALLVFAQVRHSPNWLAVTVALIAAFFEEGARYLGLWTIPTMRRSRSWGTAMCYGAGWGAAEAIRY